MSTSCGKRCRRSSPSRERLSSNPNRPRRPASPRQPRPPRPGHVPATPAPSRSDENSQKAWPASNGTSPSWRERSPPATKRFKPAIKSWRVRRSEEHTSELQSQSNLVCRLLLEKKKIEETSCHCFV